MVQKVSADFSNFSPKLAKKKFYYAKWVWGTSFILKTFFIYYWKNFVRFVISPSKARFCDFSLRGYGNGFFWDWLWNYMTIASKPHIPFLWRNFLRLGSSSSCCVILYLFPGTLYGIFVNQCGRDRLSLPHEHFQRQMPFSRTGGSRKEEIKK